MRVTPAGRQHFEGFLTLRLGSSTAIFILALDDHTAQLRLSQSTLSMHTREIAPGTSYEVDTPNAALTIKSPGDVRIDVAPDGRTTTVTVHSGGVTAYGDGAAVPIAPASRSP